MKIRFSLTFLLSFALFITGCIANEPTEMPIPTMSQNDLNTDTPTKPTESEIFTGYPVNSETGYPLVDNPSDEIPQGPEFSILGPVQAGDLIVTGSGPAEVPLRLVSVSEVGRMIAETVIDEDGVFTFTLDEPLEAGLTIGLMLGDLSGTDLNESDFLYSDTYYARPLIGILFDMVVVQ